MFRKSIRHGDVWFKPIEHLPAGAQRRSEAILAFQGETGQAHVLSGPDLELYEHQGRGYAVVPAGSTAVLSHGDHAPVAVEAGVWEFTRASTFDYPIPSEPTEHTATVPRSSGRVSYSD